MAGVSRPVIMVQDKAKKLQQQMLLNHLDLTLNTMLVTHLTEESEFSEGLTRLKEIFDSIYPLYTRYWKHMRMKQKDDKDFFAWKARHYVSFHNAKMSEMRDKDHLILSLVCGTKEGKIKSKITTLRDATMAQIDDIARAVNCIASIKEQTNSPPNQRAYKADVVGDGFLKKECNKF